MAIFPTGAPSARSADCILRPRDPARDLLWVDNVACTHEPVAFARMQTLVGPLPVSLPESMFDLPRMCTDDMAVLHDLTPLGSTAPRDFLRLQPDSADMLGNVLQLMQLEFGASYTHLPALPGRLLQAWNRLADLQWNSTAQAALGGLARPSDAHNVSSPCCMGFEPCEDTPLPKQAACRDYAACVTKEAAPTCMAPWQERPCHCDYALATALALPGQSGCGDCLDNEESCDCYVMAWMIQFAAANRPCWCVGVCVKALQPYLCRATRICPGSPTSTRPCYLDLGWCTRDQELLCSKCHLAAPINDADGHC